jgi:hypothetical protein
VDPIGLHPPLCELKKIKFNMIIKKYFKDPATVRIQLEDN